MKVLVKNLKHIGIEKKWSDALKAVMSYDEKGDVEQDINGFIVIKELNHWEVTC